MLLNKRNIFLIKIKFLFKSCLNSNCNLKSNLQNMEISENCLQHVANQKIIDFLNFLLKKYIFNKNFFKLSKVIKYEHFWKNFKIVATCCQRNNKN